MTTRRKRLRKEKDKQEVFVVKVTGKDGTSRKVAMGREDLMRSETWRNLKNVKAINEVWSGDPK